MKRRLIGFALIAAAVALVIKGVSDCEDDKKDTDKENTGKEEEQPS